MITYNEAFNKVGAHFLAEAMIEVTDLDTVRIELDNEVEGCCELCYSSTPVVSVIKIDKRGREKSTEISNFDDFMEVFYTIITEN